MAVSEARVRANKKYREAHQDNIVMTIQKEVKERYKAEAEKRGLSLTKFICQCVDQVIDSGTGS